MRPFQSTFIESLYAILFCYFLFSQRSNILQPDQALTLSRKIREGQYSCYRMGNLRYVSYRTTKNINEGNIYRRVIICLIQRLNLKETTVVCVMLLISPPLNHWSSVCTSTFCAICYDYSFKEVC